MSLREMESLAEEATLPNWVLSLSKKTYEPVHDKTNKMDMRPAKTQISLGIRPV